MIHDQVELPRVYMAWLTSPIFKPGDAEADLASTFLVAASPAVFTRSLSMKSKSRWTLTHRNIR